MDPDDLEKKINANTRAVICVHMRGAPCNMDRIAAICRKHKLRLIEDCAQACGGSYKGRKLGTFGEVGLLGQAVSLSVVRELGPVLTALMVTGRNSSGIASELGSMLVSEQVDAMRALGTDPMRKLVTPRMYATLITLPLLTILSDFFGLLGGYFVSYYTAHLSTAQYWTSAYQALDFQDVFQGLIKPVFFSVVVAGIGCYFGLRTTGGTEGVGRSTTQAVVAASVLILVLDFFITKFLIGIKFT